MSVSRTEALGQLLMVGLSEERWTSTLERHLLSIKPGGILFSPRQLRKPDSTAELLKNAARTLPAACFLALEEEGGPVNPLKAFFPPLPSPRAVARRGISATERLGELIGAGLALLGFNTDLAPLLDLETPPSEKRLGGRLFGSDPHQVAQSGKSIVKGLERHGIISCAKYFPGLGAADTGSGPGPPLVGKSMTELWREDLVPYRELLQQLPLVTVGHGAYKAYDFDVPQPAALSENVVEGLLRIKVCFSRVAVADDLDTPEISHSVELGEAAVRSVNAGCDLLLTGFREKSAEECLAGLRKGIESGKILPHRVEQALARLRRAKNGISSPDGKISAAAFSKVARKFEEFSKEILAPERQIA